MTLLDIIEIYNLNSGRDLDDIESIFQDIDIDERIDKHILIGEILGECGAMRVIYETTPTYKYFSDNFFKKYKWNIEKLLDTLELKYNPLENKNWKWTETTDISQNLDTQEEKEENRTKANTGNERTDNTETEAITDVIDESKTNTGTQSKSNTGTQSKTNTGTQSTSGTVDTTKDNTGTEGTISSGTEDNTISAMNSSTYEPDSHKTTSGNSTRTDNLQEVVETTSSEERTDNLTEQRTDNLTEQRTDNLSETKTGENTRTKTDNLTETVTQNLSETINANNDRTKNEKLEWDETDTHIEEGSDGVVYQDLIEKERKIAQFSIYNWIVKKYASELFLLVY